LNVAANTLFFLEFLRDAAQGCSTLSSESVKQQGLTI
jgi:hypothetical protein